MRTRLSFHFGSSVLLLAITLLFQCSRSPIESEDHLAAANHLPFDLIILPFNERPNTRVSVERSEQYIAPLDEDSIEMFHYRGHDYYQPVNICQACHVFLATYVETGRVEFLQRAEKYARKLLDLSRLHGDASFVPYQMRYALHGDSSLLFEPDWYSGMAQGEMLTVLSRLFKLTGNNEYRDAAEDLFRSFTALRGYSQPWVVRLDRTGYYWIEEYPHEVHPGQTLNGFITAVFGLFEYYYLVTEDQHAKKLYELSLTTLKNYLPEYHRPGQTSYYCLGHHHGTSEGYHALHIDQLRDLYAMTGDRFFQVMAELFDQSAPARYVPILNQGW